MPCAIPLIVNKEEPVFGYTGYTSYKRPSEVTFKGYTGYTGSTDYAKTIKTINFANKDFGDTAKVYEPIEYTNSSDKPYHYPSKDILKSASETLTEIKRNGYTGFTCYDRPVAIKPNVYTGSSNWVDLVKYDDYTKDSIKVFEATPEEPKVKLWQVIQVMLFDYICSINSRYDLNIPLDIVG